MEKTRRLPALPDIPPGLDPALEGWLRAAKEIIEVREGLRGEAGERFATLSELADWGVVPAETA